jgi:hypothetical protein
MRAPRPLSRPLRPPQPSTPPRLCLHFGQTGPSRCLQPHGTQWSPWLGSLRPLGWYVWQRSVRLWVEWCGQNKWFLLLCRVLVQAPWVAEAKFASLWDKSHKKCYEDLVGYMMTTFCVIDSAAGLAVQRDVAKMLRTQSRQAASAGRPGRVGRAGGLRGATPKADLSISPLDKHPMLMSHSTLYTSSMVSGMSSPPLHSCWLYGARVRVM